MGDDNRDKREDVLTLHVSSREVFDLARRQITMGHILREISKRCYSRFGRYPTKDEEREFYLTVRQYRLDHGLTVLKGKKRQREPSQAKEMRFRNQ
ncbi:MAG: hypothetical protein J5958_06695 [Clostridia bacterium]|nr:hypothetical protein [Clostridia bacterium]